LVIFELPTILKCSKIALLIQKKWSLIPKGLEILIRKINGIGIILRTDFKAERNLNVNGFLSKFAYGLPTRTD
jgi:hypothetical protein